MGLAGPETARFEAREVVYRPDRVLAEPNKGWGRHPQGRGEPVLDDVGDLQHLLDLLARPGGELVNDDCLDKLYHHLPDLRRLIRSPDPGDHRLRLGQRRVRPGRDQLQDAHLELLGRGRRQLVQVDTNELVRTEQATVRAHRFLLDRPVRVNHNGDPVLLGIAVLQKATDLGQQVRVDLVRGVELRLPDVGRIRPGSKWTEYTVQPNRRGLVFDGLELVALGVVLRTADQIEEAAGQFLEQPKEQRIALHAPAPVCIAFRAAYSTRSNRRTSRPSWTTVSRNIPKGRTHQPVSL